MKRFLAVLAICFTQLAWANSIFTLTSDPKSTTEVEALLLAPNTTAQKEWRIGLPHPVEAVQCSTIEAPPGVANRIKWPHPFSSICVVNSFYVYPEGGRCRINVSLPITLYGRDYTFYPSTGGPGGSCRFYINQQDITSSVAYVAVGGGDATTGAGSSSISVFIRNGVSCSLSNNGAPLPGSIPVTFFPLGSTTGQTAYLDPRAVRDGLQRESFNLSLIAAQVKCTVSSK